MQKTKKKIVALLMGIGACALTFATLAAAGVFGSDAAPIEQAEQVQLSDATNLRLETTDRSPGRFTLRATLTGKRPEGEGQAVQFYSGTQAVGAPVAMDASGVATITLHGTQTDAHEFGAELLGAEDAPSKVAGYVRVDGSVQWQSLPFSGTDGDPYELTSGHYYIADSVSEFDAGKPGYIIKGTSDVTFDLNGKLLYTSYKYYSGNGQYGQGINSYFQVRDNAVFTLLDSAPKDEEYVIYDEGLFGGRTSCGGHWLSWEDTKDLESSQENQQYRHTMKGGMIIGRVVSNMGAVIHATGSATVTVRDVQLYGHCAANQYIYSSQKTIGCGVIYAQDNVTCTLENVDIGYIYIFGAMSPPGQRISGVAIHAAGSARIDVKDCIIGDVYFRDGYYLNRFTGLGGAICAEQNGTIVIDGLRMEGNLFEIASFGYAIVGSGSGATIEIRNCHLKEKATIGMSFKETSTKANIVVSEGFFQYDVAQSVKNGNFTLESTSYLDDITQDPGYQGSEEVKAGYTDAVLTGAYQVQPGTPVYDGKALEQGTDFMFVNARFNLTPTYQYRSVSDSALQQGLPVNAGEYEIVLSYQEASSNYFWIPAGKETFLIEIGQYDIANATVAVTGTYEYNGTEHRPQFANLSQSGPVQFSANDIHISKYSDNVNAGTAQVVIEGIGNFTGTKTLGFTIGQRKLSNVKFQTSVSYTYDGTAKTPQLSELTYSDGTIPITSDDFYIKDYTNNTDAGLATINLEAKRNYTGSATIRFRINAKPVTAEWLLNGSAWQSSIDYTANGHLVKVSVPGLLAQDSISIELSVAEIDQNPVGTRVSATEYRLTDAFDVPYQLEVKLDGSKKSNYQLSGATNTLFIGNGVLGLKVEFFAKDGKTPLENRYSLDTNNHITINLKISDASGKAFTSDVVLTVKVASTTVQLTSQNGAFVGTADMGELTGSEYAEGGYRPAGACYANTMLPFARGAQMNLYWLLRTHPNGHEMAHGALYSPAGRAYKVTEEVQRAAQDLKKCSGFLKNSCVRSEIALHYSSTALNCFESAPLVKGFNYRAELLKKYYAAFRHHNVDVIDTQHDLSGYKVLLSPFLAVADENDLKRRVTKWVEDGGTWIVGPMSDIMDENVRRCTRSAFGFLEELAGVYVKYQRPIHNDVFRAKWKHDGELGISLWYDAFECREGTRSLAHYTAGEFAPYSVVCERQVGKGKVVVVGSVLSHADILRLVGIPSIAAAGENVTLTYRSGEQSGIIAIETAGMSGRLFLDGEYKDLLTGKALSGNIELAPYEVLVLRR